MPDRSSSGSQPAPHAPSSATDPSGPSGQHPWQARLLDLASALRQTALDWKQDRIGGMEPVQQGAGDVSFAPDQSVEACLTEWFREQAARAPLSLLTEDQGWRHAGPGPAPGSVVELPDFDHGGPRLAIDPIDGTRPWLHGLRSAWVVIAWAPPGAEGPRLSEVTWSCVEEIPLPEAAWARRLVATQGAGCVRMDLPLMEQPSREPQDCVSPDTGQLDHGFVSFFAFHPSVRARSDEFAFQFLHKVSSEHDFAMEHCYDDQYIASGGQLALMAMGHYRMLCDLRPKLRNAQGLTTQCAKPYDIAGAVLCAREAGCVVLDLLGEPLDVPLDATTDIGFVAYPGETTCKRFQGAWLELAAKFFEL